MLLVHRADFGQEIAHGKHLACADLDFPGIAGLVPRRLLELGIEFGKPV